MNKHDQEQQDAAKAQSDQARPGAKGTDVSQAAKNAAEQQARAQALGVPNQHGQGQGQYQGQSPVDGGDQRFQNPQGVDPRQNVNQSAQDRAGKATPILPTAVRDALASVDYLSALNNLCNVHGQPAVKAGAEALRGDPNYGPNAMNWLAKQPA